MKKLFAIALATISLNSNAFWGNNNYGGYGPYGYYNDNGIFGYNPYDFWDPRWYAEEMENMMDEFDDEFGNNDYYGGYYPYKAGNWNNAPWGYNRGPWNNVAPAAPVAPAK